MSRGPRPGDLLGAHMSIAGGLHAFRLLLRDRRFAHLPMVLETPKEDDADVKNLATLRRFIIE